MNLTQTFYNLEQAYLTPGEKDSGKEEAALDQMSLLEDRKYFLETLLDELYENGSVQSIIEAEEIESQLMDVEDAITFATFGI